MNEYITLYIDDIALDYYVKYDIFYCDDTIDYEITSLSLYEYKDKKHIHHDESHRIDELQDLIIQEIENKRDEEQFERDLEILNERL